MREIKLGFKPEGVSLNSRVIHLQKTYDLRCNSSDSQQATQQRTKQVS